MGEFCHIAERIAEQLSEIADEYTIGADDLAEIAAIVTGTEDINLYPGVPGYGCHNLSLFISLSSPAYVKGRRGHLSCREAIEKVVQHMQGSCVKSTGTAVLLTDSWNPAAAHEWGANLKQIANTAHLEVYLITGRTVSEIRI